MVGWWLVRTKVSALQTGAWVSILRSLGRGLAVRLVAYAALLLGFMSLYEGFSGPSIPMGLLGGVLIIAGMWRLAFARRGTNTARSENPAPVQEDNARDSLH